MTRNADAVAQHLAGAGRPGAAAHRRGILEQTEGRFFVLVDAVAAQKTDMKPRLFIDGGNPKSASSVKILAAIS
jgi:hypothetical protein